MELVFMGTGCGLPSIRRAPSCLAVLTRNESILVDSGPGSLRQLEAAGLSYKQLDFILYTHFHPDHFAELIAFLFAIRYWPGPDRTTPVNIFGAAGLLDIYEHLKAGFGHYIEPPADRVLFRELAPGQTNSFQCGSVEVQGRPVIHTPKSLGYRLTGPGGSTLVITGDTDYGPEVVDLAGKADTLVCECSFPTGQKVKGHLTAELAGRLAREAGAGRLVLTHFYPETEGSDILGEVKKEYSGKVILAEDLMRLEV